MSSTASGTTLKVQTVRRVFEHKSLKLPDPNPEASPEAVREHYATQYPELTNSRVVSEGIQDGEEVFKFEGSIGTKG